MRIAGVNIADNRQIWVGLTDIYGIGTNTSKALLQKLKIEPMTKVKELTDTQIEMIRKEIEQLSIEGDLRTALQQSIKHHTTIHTYRGVRHLHKLPVRGQRTKTNARTKRGKRVTVGSGRKATGLKT